MLNSNAIVKKQNVRFSRKFCVDLQNDSIDLQKNYLFHCLFIRLVLKLDLRRRLLIYFNKLENVFLTVSEGKDFLNCFVF